MSDAATPAVNRTLLIALGAVAVLALLFFFVISPVLLGGDDEPDGEVDVVVTPAPEATDDDVELADPEDLEGEPPAETFEIFSARDPFQQLVTEGGGGGGTPDPDASPGTGTIDQGGGVIGGIDSDGDGIADGIDDDDDGDGVVDSADDDDDGDGVSDANDDDTTTDGDGDGDDDGDADGDGGTSDDASVGGTSVSLVDIFRDDQGEARATVSVNGTAYTVSQGETFGRRFRLLDISGRCATMLFGDSRFTLCEGERIRK